MDIYGAQDVANVQKWSKVLEASNDTLEPIKSHETKMGVARMLENTKKFLEATPTTVAAGIAGYDQVMLSMVRRMGPTMLGNQLIGVQPMSGPTGLVFALRPRYNNQTGREIHAQAPNTTFTGLDSAGAAGADPATVPTDVESDPLAIAGFTVSQWMSTAQGEGDINSEISLTVDSVPVQSRTRNLKSNFSHEMAQDLASQHGVDANSMFGALMANQITSEINYESLRLIYATAVLGAQDTTTPGEFDLTADTDGRWIGERGKVLAMRIQHEASIIMQQTRMGAGNFVVCGSKAYNLLYNAGLISDLGPSNNMFSGSDPVIRDTTVAVGRMTGGMLVYRDDYAQTQAGEDFILVGWKGAGISEAGMFYAPYVPLWTVAATDPDSGQPINFMKTRAGRVANPMAGTNGALTARSNPLYRIFKVTGIML